MIYFFKQLGYVVCIINQLFILSLNLFIVLLIDLVIINAIRHAYDVMLRTSMLNILRTQDTCIMVKIYNVSLGRLYP